MSEMGDAFREHREYMRGVKEARADEALDILSKSGIAFETLDCGRHLIFRDGNQVVDFWPTTGRWFDRKSGRRGRWVDRLLEHLSGQGTSRSSDAGARSPSSPEPKPPAPA